MNMLVQFSVPGKCLGLLLLKGVQPCSREDASLAKQGGHQALTLFIMNRYKGIWPWGLYGLSSWRGTEQEWQNNS